MYEDLKKVLMKALMAVSPTWETRVDGKEYTPKADTPYQEAHLIELAPLRSSFGFGKTNFPQFIYQVNLYYPVREHTNLPLQQRCDKVMNAFYPTHGRGGVINFGNHSATFDQKPKLGPYSEGTTHLMQVLDIPFYAQINPTA